MSRFEQAPQDQKLIYEDASSSALREVFDHSFCPSGSTAKDRNRTYSTVKNDPEAIRKEAAGVAAGDFGKMEAKKELQQLFYKLSHHQNGTPMHPEAGHDDHYMMHQFEKELNRRCDRINAEAAKSGSENRVEVRMRLNVDTGKLEYYFVIQGPQIDQTKNRDDWEAGKEGPTILKVGER
jgi:hypothetical protein